MVTLGFRTAAGRHFGGGKVHHNLGYGGINPHK